MGGGGGKNDSKSLYAHMRQSTKILNPEGLSLKLNHAEWRHRYEFWRYNLGF